MIDNFALGLTHGLLMLIAFLLLKRPDLDREGPAGSPHPRHGPGPKDPSLKGPPFRDSPRA